MDIQKMLIDEFSLKPFQVENTVKLIDEGNTIPFIARYRKEMTGSLDDQVLRAFYDRLEALRNLQDRKEQVSRIITEQENMTEEIQKALDQAMTMTEVEDIYRPFKPKRRTRATVAKEKGLAPLADIIMDQKSKEDLRILAKDFIDAEKGVHSEDEAIQGAMDILAEQVSDDAGIRKALRKAVADAGDLVSKAIKEEEESVYEMYYNFREPISKVAGHRVLALNRGEKEEFLSVKIEIDHEQLVQFIYQQIKKEGGSFQQTIKLIAEDAYKRLIFPSIEREIRSALTEKAEEGAIQVFGENLKQLLLQPPIQDKIVLALDPAFRTGCKIAVIDATGKVLATTVVYPTPPQNKTEEAKKVLKGLIQKHQVEIIAIGNGTASRESEKFVVDMLKEIPEKVSYIIVNEAGASVYSASKLGAEEFPQFDVALRSAVSIGRRLQDPLAELVKIDPKSIGVGQYQHDMNQKNLSSALGGVVEQCVNSVGVDLNTASPSLLSYVAGINQSIAKNIVAFREETGRFSNRKQLLKVKKLGPKAFEQCAGFLRIPSGDNPLDNTGVHPESYDAAGKLLAKTGLTPEQIADGGLKLQKAIEDMNKMAEEIGVGVPTLKDIVKELEKPGRDPRDEMPPPILRSDILEMEDLKEGMVLMGTVRNVIDFGAFVDIGVHQDGLVHISQIADRYIKHPLEAVSVGDIVKVKVLGVDVGKKRISLTMRNVE